jgi:hypothetical protein
MCIYYTSVEHVMATFGTSRGWVHNRRRFLLPGHIGPLRSHLGHCAKLGGDPGHGMTEARFRTSFNSSRHDCNRTFRSSLRHGHVIGIHQLRRGKVINILTRLVVLRSRCRATPFNFCPSWQRRAWQGWKKSLGQKSAIGPHAVYIGFTRPGIIGSPIEFPFSCKGVG